MSGTKTLLRIENGKELTDRQRALFYRLVKTLEARIESGNDDTIITLSPDEFKEFTGFEYTPLGAIQYFQMVNLSIEIFTNDKGYLITVFDSIEAFGNSLKLNLTRSFLNTALKMDLLAHNSIKYGITSKCGLALYDLIVNDAGFLPWTVTLEDFKIAMGIEPGQYPRPTSLRDWCIETGVAELSEKSYFKISYKWLKSGKNITGLTFFLMDEDF